MIAAGLVAKKAVELGLNVKPWVKTSLAPGSKVVSDYLNKSGLTIFLDQIGFNLVGYGCTTCIGNSGTLEPKIQQQIKDNILRGVYAYGFEKPSNIQYKSIPIINAGKDIIGQSQSGTGKTGAFTIGSLCRIDDSKKETQVLILVPTRELAEQVYKVVQEISSFTGITCLKVIGGTNVTMC